MTEVSQEWKEARQEQPHYYHAQEVSPERPSPWGAYLWQLMTMVSAAGIVGLTAWLFNIESRLGEITNNRAAIARLEGGREGNRSIIDRNSDRLTKIEAKIDQFDSDRESAREQAVSLSGDLRSLREAQQNLVIELTRLGETMRQLRDELNSVRGENRGWQQLPPAERDRQLGGPRKG